MSLFCCNSVLPYKAQRTDHEMKFVNFMAWAKSTNSTSEKVISNNILPAQDAVYAIQMVRQVNYGPLESKRYFVCFTGQDRSYTEVSEDFLIRANFQKVNSYKNFKCDNHNKFHEFNLYQKDPVNKHHWRANLARPGSNIDL